MTAVGSEISASHVSTNRPTRHARVLDLFRDPLRTFVVLAVLAGGYLAFTVPSLGGIDEKAHFYRSYQISTGHLVPERTDRAGFSGACIPVDVIVQVERDKAVYYRHLLDLAGSKAVAPKPPRRSEVLRCPGDTSDGLVTFSTFGSPVPYAPQVMAILVTRSLGLSVNGMLLAGRLAMLMGYIVVVAFAIRRSPRAKWALCATALLPVAVFQSASSVSHDAITTAVALFVLSSALRAVDPPDGVTPRQLLVEALLASTVLGLCKPVYVVVAFCYLLPLLGSRRRPESRLLAIAPLLGVIVSLAWNQIVGDLWKTDAGYFGIRPDPSHQKHELITAPWHFAADALRTLFEQVTDWVRTLVEVGPSVTHWPWILAVVMLLVFVGVSIQRDQAEPACLHVRQRLLLLAVLSVGVVMIIAANYVYWTDPGSSTVGGVQPRYFMPLVALLPVAIGPVHFGKLRLRATRIPLALALVPALVVFLVSASFRMH